MSRNRSAQTWRRLAECLPPCASARALLVGVLRHGMAAFALATAGCSGEAPTLTIFGSYFPAWLACAIAGIVAAVIARVLIVVLGLDAILPWQVAVCAAIGAIVAMLVAIAVFGL